MKKLLFIAFAILIAFISLATFASCNNGGGEPCCPGARDENGDCKCDACGADWTQGIYADQNSCTPKNPPPGVAEEKKTEKK